jgi:predicted transcriptional regulator
MEQYFHDVVSSLSMDEMRVLGILFDNEATVTFKAMATNSVVEQGGLSEALYRKIMYRLSANKLIQVVPVKRQHSMIITQYGIEALKNSLKEMGA